MQGISRFLIRWSLAVALGVAAMLLFPIAVIATGGTATLSLAPSHGPAGAAFTATYTRSPCKTTAGTAVDFYWNDYPPTGGRLLGSALLDASCTARLSTAAPAAAKPAAYAVYGFIPSGGLPASGTLASATFTVDPMPGQASASAGATTTASARPSAATGSGPMASLKGLFGPVPLGWLLLAGLFALVLLGTLAWGRRSSLGREGTDRKAA